MTFYNKLARCLTARLPQFVFLTFVVSAFLLLSNTHQRLEQTTKIASKQGSPPLDVAARVQEKENQIALVALLSSGNRGKSLKQPTRAPHTTKSNVNKLADVKEGVDDAGLQNRCRQERLEKIKKLLPKFDEKLDVNTWLQSPLTRSLLS
jgi:hypothetical protein